MLILNVILFTEIRRRIKMLMKKGIILHIELNVQIILKTFRKTRKEEGYEKSREESMEDIHGIKRKRSEESMEVIKSEESSITKKQKLEESTEVEESREVEESEESTEAGVNPRRCINCGAICCADCFRETSPEDNDEEDRGSVEDNIFILDVLAGNYTPTPPKDVIMEDISSEN